VLARVRLRVVLLIQHAMGMCHAVTSFVDPLAPQYLSTLSHKGYDFRGWGGGKLFNINVCVDLLKNFCLDHFPFYGEFRAILS
jgi:hypothetical protein